MFFVEKHRRLAVHEIFFELTKKISVRKGETCCSPLGRLVLSLRSFRMTMTVLFSEILRLARLRRARSG